MNTDQFKKWLKVSPLADQATLAILTVINLTLGVGAVQGAPVEGALIQHLLLEAGFLGLSLRMTQCERSPWVAWARPAAVIAMMFILYGSLAHVAFAAIPWSADAWLNELDQALFLGHSPALVLEPLATPARVEVMSVIYGLFIPFLHLGIMNGLLKRSGPDRERFLDGFALIYGLSFLGYLFLPAKGPIDFLAGAFESPLQGGVVYGLIVKSVDSVGGPHGAVPSLHIGASLYLCVMEIHLGRKRGWWALPFVGLLYFATVFLRYHYVIDLLAGTYLALAAVYLAALRSRSRACTAAPSNRGQRRRQISNRPQLEPTHISPS
jgi:hypothetical protein